MEQPKGFSDIWKKTPFAMRILFAGSALISLGTMFLTTINNSLKIAFYAGVGVFLITVGVSCLFWAIAWAVDQ